MGVLQLLAWLMHPPYCSRHISVSSVFGLCTAVKYHEPLTKCRSASAFAFDAHHCLAHHNVMNPSRIGRWGGGGSYGIHIRKAIEKGYMSHGQKSEVKNSRIVNILATDGKRSRIFGPAGF